MNSRTARTNAASKRGKGRRRKGRRITRMPNQRFRTVTDGHVVAPETVVSLDYLEVDTFVAPAALNTAYAWHTNDAYDVYPGTGGASLIGYQTWSDFYTNFRVLSYFVDLEVSNNESFPVMFYVVNSTQDSSGAPGSMIQYSQGPLSFSKMLAPKGTSGAMHRFRFGYTIQKVIGSVAPLTADNFMGTTDGALRVADKTYLTLGASSTGSSTLVNGVTYKLRFRFNIKFYSRKAISS